MSETVHHCPLCKSEHSRLFDSRSFHGMAVVNRICQDCGLVFQSPRMTEVESASFYAEEYRLFNEGSIDPTSRNTAAQHARAESLLAFSKPVVGKVSHHLDVGCSMGILLQCFAENYRCQPVGIEPGEAHRARANKEGLAVYASLEALESAGAGHFDLISMAHVLEHLPDPVGYLAHLREALMDPQGWLLLEVPNLYAHDSFEVAHLVSYSTHTLLQTLKKTGFEVLKIERHGRPRSDVLPLYITLLAHPKTAYLRSQDVRAEKQVHLKRQIGMLRRRILEKLMPSRAWLKE
ncbi:MAG: class I SAM-dependent methyltransferase [Anaerolineales bacterium]|jgi:2-polyprenyl-3-methyl-5-hydroxy-6-metoxy-1,4-benzoquinol methylase